MKKGFEAVSQDTFKYLHVFLVHMASRTPHIHRKIELGLVMDGKLTVREGKREWLLEKDEMYLINAMEAHEFVARDPHTRILAIQVSGQWAGDLPKSVWRSRRATAEAASSKRRSRGA